MPIINQPGSSGGGSQPGVARVLGPFPFAFDTAGIENGHTVYTPATNDVLLDAWIEILTAFDGTTPKAQIAVGASGFAQSGTSIFADLSVADTALAAGIAAGFQDNGMNLSLVQTGATNSVRVGPARFIGTDPVKIVVSQDGHIGGDPVGGAAGAGRVYLIVATPSLT